MCQSNPRPTNDAVQHRYHHHQHQHQQHQQSQPQPQLQPQPQPQPQLQPQLQPQPQPHILNQQQYRAAAENHQQRRTWEKSNRYSTLHKIKTAAQEFRQKVPEWIFMAQVAFFLATDSWEKSRVEGNTQVQLLALARTICEVLIFCHHPITAIFTAILVSFYPPIGSQIAKMMDDATNAVLANLSSTTRFVQPVLLLIVFATMNSIGIFTIVAQIVTIKMVMELGAQNHSKEIDMQKAKATSNSNSN